MQQLNPQAYVDLTRLWKIKKRCSYVFNKCSYLVNIWTDHLLILRSGDIIRMLEQNGRLLGNFCSDDFIRSY